MSPAAAARAVFLDRDGTLAEEVGYVNHASRLRLLPGSAAALRRIREAGLLSVVVTNQSGVARDYFEEAIVHQAHERLRGLLAAEGTSVDAVYYCPHHPREGIPPYRQDCDCRKPLPGMLLRASRELGIDLARSYMVGDGVVDVGAGRAAGTTTILVLTGYGRGHFEHRRHLWTVQPDHVAEDLGAAVDWILERERGSR
ncbi:MAG TPA: HAD family hydrolase [Candidatus Polarisedimenticolia bacterium]|jgi:D-glycero-D-manno-heptose 1,7-bisphosphate phosphatase|nr:HAD family hydrolase [Candidatus Polarisedimenticolia bacterium]